MRVAIANWNGRVSPVFDCAREVVLVDTDGVREVPRSTVPLEETYAPRRAARLARLGVNVLICGGISNPLVHMIEANGIRVMPGTTGPVDEVLGAFLAGRLPGPTFAMPGWRGRGGHRFRGGRGLI